MKLKTMCDEFLQRVLAERTTAINEAISHDIQTIHKPYEAKMVSARDKAIANEEQKFNALVEQLTKEHNALVSSIRTDFGKAIQSHRDEVARSAEAKAKVEYDEFIREVATAADRTIKTN